MNEFDVTVTCSVCRQALTLPAHDLAQAFTCPRCGTTQPAAVIVPLSTAVRAVPAPPGGSPGRGQVSPAFSAPAQAGEQGGGYREERVRVDAPSRPVDEVRERAADIQSVAAARPPGVRSQQARATRLVVALGRAASWLDSIMEGRRLLVLGVLGVLVWCADAARTIDPWGPDVTRLVYVPLLLCYSAFVYLLLLARLWWVRDDDGSWNWPAFRRRFLSAVANVRRSFLAAEFSWENLLSELAQALSATGFGILVLGTPIEALLSMLAGATGSTARASTSLTTPQMIGFGTVAAGAFSWLLSRRRKSAATRSFEIGAQQLAVRTDLPLVIDLFDAAVTRMPLPQEIHRVLDTLAAWKPRAMDWEEDYEASLKRFLVKRLPGVKVDRQRQIDPAQGKRGGIVDVVVDDILAIEIKKELRTSGESDRAVAQVWKYAEVWKRGPLFVLLCETRPGFAHSPIIRRIGELRGKGCPILVIAAGRRMS